MSQRTPEPVAISADGDTRLLDIEWSDGHQSRYSYEHLRWACPCATCRGEWGRPGLLDMTTHLAPGQTELDDIRPVGRYAIAPVWCDGHDTGIYTYAYLRELCQCPDCTAQREAARRAGGAGA